MDNYYDNNSIFLIDESLLEGYIKEESTYEFKVKFSPTEEFRYETVLQFNTVLGLEEIKLKGTGIFCIITFIIKIFN